MSHIRLFEHPASRALLEQAPPLGIAGDLPNAKPSLAYEGRLSIVGLGQAAAEVVSVTGTLPPGSTVTVDNATDQVVVAWPAYQAGAAPIPNPDFELGDRDWLKGAGWSIAADAAQAGFGTKCALWNGHGEAVIESAMFAAVTAGQSITASCQVAQGASSQGNCGAAVQLRWYSASYGPLPVVPEGNMVASSNPSPQTSSVTASAPANGFVRIAARGYRKRQNKVLRVDNFAWNATQPSVGTNVDGTIGPITIRIRDTLGRDAEWTGSIVVSLADPMLASGTGAGVVVSYLEAGGAWTGISPAEVSSLYAGGLGVRAMGRWALIPASNASAKYSDDNVSWPAASGVTTNVPSGQAAHNGAGVIIAVGVLNRMWRSLDNGASFSAGSLFNNPDPECIAYGNGLWLAGVAGTARGPFQYSTNDGTSWTQGAVIVPYQVRCAKYVGGKWYIGGGDVSEAATGYIKRSDNGISGYTTLQTLPASPKAFATDGNGRWVAILGNNAVIYTADNWQTYATSVTAFTGVGNANPDSVVFNGSSFVMRASGVSVITSPTGEAWSAPINTGISGTLLRLYSAFTPP